MKLKNNSISVVIPMYNSSKTIINAIKSVLNQTYINKIREVIIVNDGSQDNSQIIVKEFISNNADKMSFMLINKENGGVSSARNLGMEKI